MPHWLIKSAIQRAISWLPQSQKCNEWFQQRVTKSLTLSAGPFEDKLKLCHRYLEDLLHTRPQSAAGFRALELGTGWFPTMPVGLYLCGADEIWSFDIDPLLSHDRLKLLVNMFCEYDRKGLLPRFLPHVRPERMGRLRELAQASQGETPQALLAKLNIHTLVRDARNTGLGAESIDLVFSYSVLEYIPREVLAQILAEFKRVARNDAVMIHQIDLFDQFCGFDKSITALNFLKFSAAQWQWLRSPLIPLSRLRISEYRQLVSQAGFEITKETTTSATLETLGQIRLAPEFQKFSPADLLVLTAWLVAKKA